jgi:KaiC/GvpD/RAD55 family RecA-like ATPase
VKEMKREKLNTLSEKDIIYQLIVSDKFCREIVPVLNPKFLEVSYIKIVAIWIKDYFQKFKESPKKNIIKLYRSHIDELKDESLQENILTFIEKLDKDYDSIKVSNEDFAIQNAIKYLKARSLKNFSEDIDSYIASGDIEKAENCVTKFRKVEIASGEGVSLLEDSDIITESFTEEQDLLFAYPGDFGRLIGDIHREDFIAFLAPMKAGKTYQLVDFGIESLKNNLKVAMWTLEMSRTNMIKRAWTALSGQITKDIEIEVPYFEEDGDKWRIEKKVVNKKASSVLEVQKKQRSLKRLFRGGAFRIYAEPAYSMTVESLENKLDDLAYEGFYPDVIIIDYADIMAPSDKNEYRQQIDGIWKRLRALAQKRKAVVVTASQTNRGAISREVEAEDVAEDVRKIAHVTSMVAISKTKYCKQNKLAIFSQMAIREGEPEMRKVVATQNLALGRPILESHWKDDVIFDDEENKTERKRK